LHKDGHPIETSVTISPVKGKGGAVVGASVIARDITSRSAPKRLCAKMKSVSRGAQERSRCGLQPGPELRYTWINSPILAWAEREGTHRREIVGGEEGARLTAIAGSPAQRAGTRTETRYLSWRNTLFRSRRGTAPRCPRDCRGSYVLLL
jgi:hypothetical protein